MSPNVSVFCSVWTDRDARRLLDEPNSRPSGVGSTSIRAHTPSPPVSGTATGFVDRDVRVPRSISVTGREFAGARRHISIVGSATSNATST